MRDCPVCQALWRKCAQATAEHVATENKFKLAVLKREDTLIAELARTTQAANQERKQAREAFHLHETTVHAASTRGAAG